MALSRDVGGAVHLAGFFLTWEDGDYIEFAFNVDIRVVGAKFYVEHQLWPCYYKWYGVRASGSWWFVCSVEGASLAYSGRSSHWLGRVAQVSSSGVVTTITGAGVTAPDSSLQAAAIGWTPGTFAVTFDNSNFFRKYRYGKYWGGGGTDQGTCGSPGIYEVEFPGAILDTYAPTEVPTSTATPTGSPTTLAPSLTPTNSLAPTTPAPSLSATAAPSSRQ